MRKRRRSAQIFRRTSDAMSGLLRGLFAAPLAFPKRTSLRAPVGRSLALVVIAFFILAGQAALFIDEARLILHGEAQQEKNGIRLFHLRMVVEGFLDADLGQQDFLLTGHEASLEPYAAAARNIDRSLNVARRMFVDEPAVLAQLA